MSRVHYLEGDYEQLVINETIDGLFSCYRIDRNSLPEGFFLYEIRWDDSLSSLAEISPSVVVNHAGSFITKSPLEFDASFWRESKNFWLGPMKYRTTSFSRTKA